MENSIGFTGSMVKVNNFRIMDDSAHTIFAGFFKELSLVRYREFRVAAGHYRGYNTVNRLIAVAFWEPAEIMI